jgi:hypothetical protein
VRPVEAHGLRTSHKHTASNPPLRDLKVSDPNVRDLTLAELGLAPSSILHLRFVDDSLNGEINFFFCNAQQLVTFFFYEPFELISRVFFFFSFHFLFLKKTKQNPGSNSPAPLASAVLEHAVDLPAPPDFDGNPKKKGTSSAVSASGPSSSTVKDPTGAEVKVPKWLKLGSSAFPYRSLRPCLVRNFLFQRSECLYTQLALLNPSLTSRSFVNTVVTLCTRGSDTCHIDTSPKSTSVIFTAFTCISIPAAVQTMNSKGETQGRRRATTRGVHQPDL